jgi:hypothetical protein
MLMTGASTDRPDLLGTAVPVVYIGENASTRTDGYGGDHDRALLSNAVWPGDSLRGSKSGDGIGACFAPSVISGHVQVLHVSGAQVTDPDVPDLPEESELAVGDIAGSGA